ncbi:zinc metallopeptidase [candidate division KSB1 bacterium]|nr:zinc metallopeptidase [candidate division KSB1 bacterium]
MYFGFFSLTDLMLLVPAMILALYAQYKVKSVYEKYARVPSAKGVTGAQVAHSILQNNNIQDVEIEEIEGNLSDHYDPRSKKLRLSSPIYRSSSVAALGIAAHEVGHAIQHHHQYAPLKWRTSIVPVASIGSSMAIPLFIAGLFMNSGLLMDLGIWFFVGAVLFQIVTLPVEFNASSRAIAQLRNGGFLVGEEVKSARRVLNAAAMTYVAAAAVAVMHLLRLVLLRGSRD